MTDRPSIEDWITIWHSEMAAMATDRELHEAWQRMADAWAAHARLFLPAWTPQDDHPAGPAGPQPPARTPPARDAPDRRDALIDDLRARVAELERRLADPPGG